ncbi:DegV family protein [Desulfococcaceae bacterium HSG7]|nr:DegV family protein [Desulfococcaceae bacterium HSG9]MDM8554823.1 DegV family protein [Desulfococcaceae bacterium HSG7]
MNRKLHNACIVGLERMTAWADLTDRINVFPVADGDTGRNLVISLSPFRRPNLNTEEVIHALWRSACGNSGNIAVSFFAEFIKADSERNILNAAINARDAAWQAIHSPREGTMLSVFDTLVEVLTAQKEARRNSSQAIIDHLAKTVWESYDLLPELQKAGVVDSGALGVFLFLEGFFNCLYDADAELTPITQRFKNRLQISSAFQAENGHGHCINAVVQAQNANNDTVRRLLASGDSVVASADDELIKIHLHADDKNAVRQTVESMGRIVHWSEENLKDQVKTFKRPLKDAPLHIMTDAAGSLSVKDASNHGFTLLNSYIVTLNEVHPETLCDDAELYRYMRQGGKASTAQASQFERYQYYESALNQYDRILYLCVGSAFTGNYATAMAWKKKHDRNNRFTVIDTGAASGRLAMIVIATLDYLARADNAAEVIAFAQTAVEQSAEFIFLDRLHYLAAGGRLSKSSAFWGDLVRVKPIITPTSQGAKKAGQCFNRKAQIRFAMEKLADSFDENSTPLIMLEYTDNREWVADIVQHEIKGYYSQAEIKLQPLSLTSGVHTGPGTWGMAFLS